MSDNNTSVGHAAALAAHEIGSMGKASVPADERPPSSSGYVPANKTSEIDALVGRTLNTATRYNADGTTEDVPVAANQSANSHNAQVAEPPSVEDLDIQKQAHVARINQIQQKLSELVYSRRTGQAEGYAVTGRERDVLERQLGDQFRGIEYLDQLFESTREARAAWNQARAAEAARGSATAPSTDAVEDAVKREAAITQLAEQRVNGKAIGRVEAARMYDEAAARALAAKLASA